MLRTFLPQQTADLRGGIYRVVEWASAAALPVDQETVRRRLVREIGPWSAAGEDSGFGAALRKGANVEVVQLDYERGVTVERFPRVWLCRTCRRVGASRERACRCGKRTWGQLHFVGFHDCGYVCEPWVKRCPQHDDVKVVLPRSAKASNLVARKCGAAISRIVFLLGSVTCRADATACGYQRLAKPRMRESLGIRSTSMSRQRQRQIGAAGDMSRTKPCRKNSASIS